MTATTLPVRCTKSQVDQKNKHNQMQVASIAEADSASGRLKQLIAELKEMQEKYEQNIAELYS